MSNHMNNEQFLDQVIDILLEMRLDEARGDKFRKKFPRHRASIVDPTDPGSGIPKRGENPKRIKDLAKQLNQRRHADKAEKANAGKYQAPNRDEGPGIHGRRGRRVGVNRDGTTWDVD